MVRGKRMDWKRKNVLVTGADGFIGSWIAKGVIEREANVVTITRDVKKPKISLDLLDIRDKMTLVQGDITDYHLVHRVLNEYSIDTVFHLAAQAIVETANRSPISTFDSNIKGTWVVLEAVRNSKLVERVVVASSDKAYGDQEKLPYTEDMPLLGLYPYDASKACTDILSRCYAKTYGLPIAVTRCANVYGGADLHMNRLVPGTICAVLRGEVPVIRSDGSPKRDYMYIKDAVNAYMILAENLDRKEIRGEAFNFGTEKPISVLELFNKIIKICGKKVKPKILNIAKNEIQCQYLSSEKARKVLGWSVKYSLDEGLKETVRWYRKYLENSP
jgi:CDP-glucose 4,6-dehydratase